MTPEELQAIRERAEAATEGPWQLVLDVHPVKGDADFIWSAGAEHPVAYSSQNNPDDDLFIAHARTDIPALLAEVERLRDVDAIYDVLEAHRAIGFAKCLCSWKPRVPLLPGESWRPLHHAHVAEVLAGRGGVERQHFPMYVRANDDTYVGCRCHFDEWLYEVDWLADIEKFAGGKS